MDKMLKCFIWIGVIFAFFWVLLIVVNQFDFFRVEIMYEGLLLTFIGILATFVVVSNYIQVNEIKKEMYSEILKIKQQQEELDRKLIGMESVRDKLNLYEDILNNKRKETAVSMIMKLKDVIESNDSLKKSGGYIFPVVEESDMEAQTYKIAIRGNTPENSTMDVRYRYKVNIKTGEILQWDFSTGEYNIKVEE